MPIHYDSSHERSIIIQALLYHDHEHTRRLANRAAMLSAMRMERVIEINSAAYFSYYARCNSVMELPLV